MQFMKMPTGHATWGWVELMTNDARASKDFYTKLLGWTTEEKDMGPAGTYTLWHSRGEKLGGMMQIPPHEAASMRPGWMPYVQVESLDATYARATELGAKTIVPPMPIPDVGRFAIILDPTGVAISLLQYD